MLIQLFYLKAWIRDSSVGIPLEPRTQDCRFPCYRYQLWPTPLFDWRWSFTLANPKMSHIHVLTQTGRRCHAPIAVLATWPI